MSADYAFGHGVEVAESKGVYFATRDLTVNEILFRNGCLEATFNALEDSRQGVLTPTPYIETAARHMQARTLMKAIRLASEALVLNIPMSLRFCPDDVSVTPFDVALHLRRALAAGPEVAEEFIFSAWKLGVLLPELEAPPVLEEALEYFRVFLPLRNKAVRRPGSARARQAIRKQR